MRRDRECGAQKVFRASYQLKTLRSATKKAPSAIEWVSILLIVEVGVGGGLFPLTSAELACTTWTATLWSVYAKLLWRSVNC